MDVDCEEVGSPLAAQRQIGSRSDQAVAWLFRRPLCFGGLAGALVFFCLSLTPSLLPRSWFFQAAISGFSTAIGYGIGSGFSAMLRRVLRNEPSAATKRVAWRLLGGAAVALMAIFIWSGVAWQQEVRRLMGMEDLAAYHWVLILGLSIVASLLLLVLARIVRGLNRLLNNGLSKFVPRPLAIAVGVLVTAMLVTSVATDVLFKSVVSVANSSFSVTNNGTSDAVSTSTSLLRTGGPDSLVSWESLGTRGRDFTGDGGSPTIDEIEAFTGRDALEPIRVYVGLKSADSSTARAELAVAELERTGAFDRSVLVIYTVTGTGWIDPTAAASIDFMYGGDTAGVAIQYSYLPSWISFLVDKEKAADAGRALIRAVTDRVSEFPATERPQVLIFGESLGSFGSESGFDNFDDLLKRSDGAVFVGPTFNNPIHNDLRAARDAGSPFWRPVVDGGRQVRQAVRPEEFSDSSLFSPSVAWEEPRVAYLQN